MLNSNCYTVLPTYHNKLDDWLYVYIIVLVLIKLYIKLQSLRRLFTH